MEWSSALSYPSDQISSALHFQGTADQRHPTAAHSHSHTTLSSSVEDWHTYQVWWSPDEIRVGVDGARTPISFIQSGPARPMTTGHSTGRWT